MCVILSVCETKSIMSTATTHYTEAEAQVHTLTLLTDTAGRPGKATDSAELKTVTPADAWSSSERRRRPP